MVVVTSLKILKILFNPCCTASKVGHLCIPHYFSTKVRSSRAGRKASSAGQAKLSSLYLKVPN